LLAREPIGKPPQLAAGGLNDNVKSAAVRKLSGLGGWLGIPHSDVFEHVGIATPRDLDTNNNTNKLAGYQQTAAY
jgi:hypothetical protein